LSSVIADHVNNQRNVGPLARFSHLGQVGVPGDGPFVILWFDVDGTRICDAAWSSNGCPTSMACASMTVQVLKGRTIDQALLLTAKDLELLLHGLPDGKGDCAVRAISAIHHAFGASNS